MIYSNKKEKGFTLIELLVVIAIIGLLSSLVFVSLRSAAVQAREITRISDLRSIKIALDAYFIDNYSYPNSLGGVGVWDGLYSCWGDSISDWIPGLVPEYMSLLPRDPRDHDICGEQYIYRSDGSDYKLLAHSPVDCEWVASRYSNLADPARDCWAYGYWTPGAINW